jgi:hypothetical protein
MEASSSTTNTIEPLLPCSLDGGFPFMHSPLWLVEGKILAQHFTLRKLAHKHGYNHPKTLEKIMQ